MVVLFSVPQFTNPASVATALTSSVHCFQLASHPTLGRLVPSMIESLSSILALRPIKTSREETGKARAEFAAADPRLGSRQEGGGTS